MTCDRLVCANCAGPVSEGRCAVCRAHRARLHQQEGGLFSALGSLPPVALAALLLTLVAVALLARQAAV
ncbi:MAG TPA: hypothetical protein VFY14_12880 [Streptomyces sp.]|nr:hypothetical protein [Streptomyces sp.]